MNERISSLKSETEKEIKQTGLWPASFQGTTNEKLVVFVLFFFSNHVVITFSTMISTALLRITFTDLRADLNTVLCFCGMSPAERGVRSPAEW